MMIDFAIEAARTRNLPPREAIHEACRLRFRPIMMTTAAAILGAVPLALGQGDGAEIRQPLGITIVGGLLVSQLLTLYTTPVVYLCLDRARLRWRRRWWRLRYGERKAALLTALCRQGRDCLSAGGGPGHVAAFRGAWPLAAVILAAFLPACFVRKGRRCGRPHLP